MVEVLEVVGVVDVVVGGTVVLVLVEVVVGVVLVLVVVGIVLLSLDVLVVVGVLSLVVVGRVVVSGGAAEVGVVGGVVWAGVDSVSCLFPRP